MVVATTSQFKLTPVSQCRREIRSTIQQCSDHNIIQQFHSVNRRAEERSAANLVLRVYAASFDVDTDTCEVVTCQPDIGITRDLTMRGVGWSQSIAPVSDYVALEFDRPDEQTLLLLVQVMWTRSSSSGNQAGGTIVGILK